MPGKQAMDPRWSWWSQRKFLALLLAIGMLLIAHPLLGNAFSTRLLLDVLLTLVFLAAFFLVFSEARYRVLTVALAVPTIIGAWIDYVLPGLPRAPLQVGFHLVAAVLFGLTIAAILHAVHKQETVSADAIYGALCGYLLVGLAFGHLYCIQEDLNPGSFQGNAQVLAQLQMDDRRHPILTYFSFVTLTSVGYGDITPGSGTVRSLAVVEAVIGQFYIAVLIGELIGKRVAQAIAGAPSGRLRTGGPFHPHVLEAKKRGRSHSAFGESSPPPNDPQRGSS